MQVQLKWISPQAEEMIATIARVSNPANESNPEYAKLIKYLIKSRHWSPFEMSSACFKITTSRAIAAQMLRHRSFSFQEFSQRYSEVTEIEPIELRKQAVKNRQSSEEVFDPSNIGIPNIGIGRASEMIEYHAALTRKLYENLIKAGVAKECARMILPLATQTTLYMSGSIRSWIHYLSLRNEEHAQKEHQLIAQEIENILRMYLPTVFDALDSIKQDEENNRLLLRLLNDNGLHYGKLKSLIEER